MKGAEAGRWGKRGLVTFCLGLAVLVAAGAALTESRDVPVDTEPGRMRVVGPEILVQIPWGTGPAALGRLDGDQAASEGPMSFAMAGDGTLWFLDQTRFRLAQFDSKGGLLREVPIHSDTFQDFEIMADGSFVLLDRLARRFVVVLDAKGKAVRSVSVEGPGIPEGGGVTAMLTDHKGIWLEFNHTERVRVLDDKLQPCERDVVRGRPFRSGVELLAALDGRGGAMVWTEDRNRGNDERSRTISAGHAISRIIWLETDATGDVHVAFHLLEFHPEDPRLVSYEEVYGIRYDADLRPRDGWSSPWVLREWEQFRELRIGPDGTVYQMGFEDGGVTVVRWRWVK